MATAPDNFDPIEYIGATEEALFARDIDGQLIRAADATLNDLDQDVRITIDGQPLVVKKAVPLRNSQGVLMSMIAAKSSRDRRPSTMLSLNSTSKA